MLHRVFACAALLALAAATGEIAATTGPWIGVTDVFAKTVAAETTVTHGATMFSEVACDRTEDNSATRSMCGPNGFLTQKAYADTDKTAAFPCTKTAFDADATATLHAATPYQSGPQCDDNAIASADGCIGTMTTCSNSNVDGHLGYPRYTYAISLYADDTSSTPIAIGAANADDTFAVGISACHIKAATASGRGFFGMAFSPVSTAVTISCIADGQAAETSVVMDGSTVKIKLDKGTSSTFGYIKVFHVKSEFDLVSILEASTHTVEQLDDAITTTAPVTTAAPKASAAGVAVTTGLLLTLQVARSVLA